MGVTSSQIESVMTTDVLVLGGGIAGYRAAVAAREADCSVVLASLAHGASPYVIGANIPLGASDPADGPQVYFDDMVRGGYGLNDRRLVQAMAAQAVPSFRELDGLGVPFARDNGRVLQRHLSGNTYPRSVFVPEGTGRVILDYLKARAKAIGVATCQGWKVVSLLSDQGEVVGALLVKRHTGELLAIRARATILAMGGIGRIYDDSTYPADIAADSYALAYDVGARLVDMEFVQFEPVVTVWPEECRGLEMPTAMLGDGARLINAKGERFMFRYNPEHGEKRIEKARMSLCIQQEIDEGRGFPDGTVLFDTTSVPRDRLESYISHCKRLRAAGVDPAVEGPRVRPAAHSQMGGVHIDHHGWSGVPGLYACGEAAGGVHGASRLAGNGGSETIIFGAIAGRGAASGLLAPAARDWPRIERMAVDSLRAAGRTHGSAEPIEIKRAVRQLMARAAGLYRDATGLAGGIADADRLQADVDAGLKVESTSESVAALEARNMLLIARLILRAALARTESRGAHQRRDHRQQDDSAWLKHLSYRRGPDGQPVQELVAIQ